MINNLLIVSYLLVIGLAWWRARGEIYLTAALVFTFAAPVMELAGRRINSSYLLTALLVLLLCLELVRKRRAKRTQTLREVPQVLRIYLLLMAVVLFTYTVGFMLYGQAGWGSFLFSMAGEVNLIVMTAILLLFLAWEAKATRQRIFTAMGWIYIGVQLSMVLFQKLFFEPAWRLTYQFYAGDGRTEPLETILVSDPPYFKRAYGTFYSPTLFGVASLVPTLLFAYQAIALYRRAKLRGDKRMYKRALVSLGGSFLRALVGTFSLSKGFMLSIGILLVYLLVLALMLGARPRRHVAVAWSGVAVSTVIAFVIVYLSMPSFASGTRDYYFGFLFNPFEALTSRYGSDVSEGGEGGQAEDDCPDGECATEAPSAVVLDAGFAPGTQIPLPTDADGQVFNPALTDGEGGGQMAETYAIFRDHWLTGVGPLPIAGEFMGDSQIVQVGHNGGILALGAYLALFIWLYLKGWKEKRVVNLLLVPIIGIACISIAFLGQVISVGIMALSLIAALPDSPSQSA